MQQESIRVAEAISNSGPVAVRSQKELIRQWEKLSLEDGIHFGIDVFSGAYENREPKIMMNQFFQRKNP